MSKKSSVRSSYSTRTTKLTTLQSKHSQSALEYMMTYGWAILIIVIVAAGLYSLGIFSPTNSASTSITGFSGLGSVQAECIGSQGLEISFGDALSNTINVTRINATESLTGKSISVNPNLIIRQGTNSIYYLQTICPIPNTPFSATVTVTYMLVGATFPGPYQVSGNIYGKAISSEISSSQSIVHFVPITIMNAQNMSTASPFQEMLNVTSFTYKNYEASNLQNVEFFYSNGTIIPSWIESGNSYTSNSTIYWLRVNRITSGSNLGIFMGFTATGENLFNSLNIGEAPQLSGTYGEYDDGANVFMLYSNFTGPGFSPGWWFTSYKGGGTYTLSDGATVSTNGTDPWAEIYSTSTSLQRFPASVYTDLISASNIKLLPGIGIYGDNNLASTGYGLHYYGLAKGGAGGGGEQVSPTPPSLTFGVMGISWISNNTEVSWINETPTVLHLAQIGITAPYAGIGIGEANSAPSSTVTFQWARVQAAPPNGVMPAALFGKFQ